VTTTGDDLRRLEPDDGCGLTPITWEQVQGARSRMEYAHAVYLEYRRAYEEAKRHYEEGLALYQEARN
jgi:hypothetical protein